MSEIKQLRTIIKCCPENLDVDTQKKVWCSLYNVFRPYIEEEASLKSGKYSIYSDVLSELKILFFETLNSIKLNRNTVTKLIAVINNHKPSKNTVKPEYLYQSIDRGACKNSGEFMHAEKITMQHNPVPESATIRENCLKEFENVLEDDVLSKKEKFRLKENGKGKSMAAIAREEKVCPSVVQNSINKGILKIQRKNGKISARYMEVAKQYAKILNCAIEDAVNMICKMPQIVKLNLSTIEKNISECSVLLGWSKEEYIKLGLKMPSYFCYNYKTLEKNIQESSKVMQCSSDYYIKKLCAKDATMLNLKPDTIMKYLNEKSEALNRPLEDIIKTTTRMPAFLYAKLSTMQKNIKMISEVLKCSKEEAINLIMEQPSTMFYRRQTLQKGLKEGSKILNCSEDEFAKLALKQKSLLNMSNLTLQKHVMEASNLLKCKPEEFIEICKTRPSFLCMKPDRIKLKSDIAGYYKKVQNKSDDKIILKFDSEEILYSQILTYLINKSANAKLSIQNCKKNLPQYLKEHQDFKFHFKIPDDVIVKEFIEFAQNYSIKTIGKNIFEFTII